MPTCCNAYFPHPTCSALGIIPGATTSQPGPPLLTCGQSEYFCHAGLVGLSGRGERLCVLESGGEVGSADLFGSYSLAIDLSSNFGSCVCPDGLPATYVLGHVLGQLQSETTRSVIDIGYTTNLAGRSEEDFLSSIIGKVNNGGTPATSLLQRLGSAATSS